MIAATIGTEIAGRHRLGLLCLRTNNFGARHAGRVRDIKRRSAARSREETATKKQGGFYSRDLCRHLDSNHLAWSSQDCVRRRVCGRRLLSAGGCYGIGRRGTASQPIITCNCRSQRKGRKQGGGRLALSKKLLPKVTCLTNLEIRGKVARRNYPKLHPGRRLSRRRVLSRDRSITIVMRSMSS